MQFNSNNEKWTVTVSTSKIGMAFSLEPAANAHQRLRKAQCEACSHSHRWDNLPHCCFFREKEAESVCECFTAWSRDFILCVIQYLLSCLSDLQLPFSWGHFVFYSIFNIVFNSLRLTTKATSTQINTSTKLTSRIPLHDQDSTINSVRQMRWGEGGLQSNLQNNTEVLILPQSIFWGQAPANVMKLWQRAFFCSSKSAPRQKSLHNWWYRKPSQVLICAEMKKEKLKVLIVSSSEC